MYLRDVFVALRAGSAPSLSGEELAVRISSRVRQTARADVTCLCLALTESIVRALSAQSLTQDGAVFYEDVTRRLFGEMDLMEKLVG